MLDDAFDFTGDLDRPRRAADAAPPRVLALPAPLPLPLPPLPLAPAAAAFRGEDEGEAAGLAVRLMVGFAPLRGVRAPAFLGMEEPVAPDRGVVLVAPDLVLVAVPAFFTALLGVVGVLLVGVLAAPAFAALRGVRLLGVRSALVGLAFALLMRAFPPIAARRRASLAAATCSRRVRGAAEASGLVAPPLVPLLAGDRDRGVRGVPVFFLGAVLRGVVEADIGRGGEKHLRGARKKRSCRILKQVFVLFSKGRRPTPLGQVLVSRTRTRLDVCTKSGDCTFDGD